MELNQIPVKTSLHKKGSVKKRGTLLDAWEQQARATYLLSSKPFTSITSIQKLQGEPNHMGYMTITDEEAYNTAIRYLKGFKKLA